MLWLIFSCSMDHAVIRPNQWFKAIMVGGQGAPLTALFSEAKSTGVLGMVDVLARDGLQVMSKSDHCSNESA